MSGRISLCLIAKNEEANLAGCLEPISGLVDEIVLVDTGSSDRTKDVAASLGARRAVIVGPREHEAGAATVRDMDSGEQREVPLGELAEALRP